jgi:hypothetical protein
MLELRKILFSLFWPVISYEQQNKWDQIEFYEAQVIAFLALYKKTISKLENFLFCTKICNMVFMLQKRNKKQKQTFVDHMLLF